MRNDLIACEMLIDNIRPLAYPTEMYKIDNAFKLGIEHAQLHFNGEELDPERPTVAWSQNPYTIDRPSVHYSWAAGFCEEWSRLCGG